MPRPTSPILLFVGPEELLLRRAAERALAELRTGGDLDVLDVRAAELREQGLPDLVTPSLFGTPRAVLVRDAQELPPETSAALVAFLASPTPEASVLLMATGTARIQKLAKQVKEAGGRIDVAPPREWEDRAWANLVTEEFQRDGRSADRAAVAAVLAHAGLNVAAIAEKVAQVAATAAPGRVGAAAVEAVVVGHGGRGTFAVADAMCDRDPERAVTLLRGVLESGDDPVLVLGALAYRMRSLVAVAGRLDLKAVGLNASPGQVKRLQGVRRNFGPGELVSSYRALAEADLEIKGGELPPAFVLERAVVAVATRN